MSVVDGMTAKAVAGVRLFGRTGSTDFSIRYSDDVDPLVWIAVVSYPGPKHEADAALWPEEAIMRLAGRLLNGGVCTHCRKDTRFTPDAAPEVTDPFCWWSYDDGSAEFVRGCAA